MIVFLLKYEIFHSDLKRSKKISKCNFTDFVNCIVTFFHGTKYYFNVVHKKVNKSHVLKSFQNMQYASLNDSYKMQPHTSSFPPFCFWLKTVYFFFCEQKCIFSANSFFVTKQLLYNCNFPYDEVSKNETQCTRKKVGCRSRNTKHNCIHQIWKTFTTTITLNVVHSCIESQFYK